MGREGQRWHRPISISFQQTQKTLTKEREVSWLHTREVTLWQGQISAHKFRHKLRPLPATNPNLSHPGTRALPLTQQLSGRLPVAHAHWLKKTILPQQQSYCSCLDTSSLVREC